MTRIRVLNPQGELRAATHALPALPSSLRGLTVGFLDNKKHNFDRLVLEADGPAEIETASKTEWRMLTATARQNPCTGEIKRGIESK